MMKKHLFAALALCTVVSALEDKKCPISAAELADITARGRMLAEYDQAAWRSTDVIRPLEPPPGSVTGYAAQKTDEGWVVAYGKFSDDGSHYIIGYLARQKAATQEYSAEKLNPPREDRAYFYHAAKALTTARSTFGKEDHPKRPYNAAVIPATDGRWFVYFTPAQTDAKVVPLGGDVRFLISKGGAQVEGRRQLHRTILEFGAVPEGTKEAAGYHTHVLSQIPEDTDIFHVLARTPRMPEYVASKEWVFVVSPDQPIACIPINAFQKMKK